MNYEYVWIKLMPLAKHLLWRSKKHKFDIFSGVNVNNFLMPSRKSWPRIFSVHFQNGWSPNCLIRAHMVMLITQSYLVGHFIYIVQ